MTAVAFRFLLVFGSLGIFWSGETASAQALGLNETQGEGLPVNITADNGIEWRQAERVYIARGNVVAVRGRVTVYADQMKAFYRPVVNKGGNARKPGDPAATSPSATGRDDAARDTSVARKPPPPPIMPTEPPSTSAAAPTHPATKAAGNSGPADEGSTEIYRLVADGNVRFVTDTQTAYGDHADYDVDQTLLVLTGKNLKAISPRDVITARDDLEWYDNRQVGIARGNALDVRDGAKRIAGDVLMAQMVQPHGQESHISRVDADGHVFVSSQDQIGRGDTGVYNADTGIATLFGDVRLTRNENEMHGHYGVVDLNRNIGHLLPAAPGTALAAGPKGRVQGLLYPHQKNDQSGGPNAMPTNAKSRGGATAKAPPTNDVSPPKPSPDPPAKAPS